MIFNFLQTLRHKFQFFYFWFKDGLNLSIDLLISFFLFWSPLLRFGDASNYYIFVASKD